MTMLARRRGFGARPKWNIRSRLTDQHRVAVVHLVWTT